MDAATLTIGLTGLTAAAMALLGFLWTAGSQERPPKPIPVKARRRRH